jgi:16S rRNA (uracil1498-N3)-methyltransferase
MILLTGDEARHLTGSLRAGPGFRFIAATGNGRGWQAEVVSIHGGRVEARAWDELPPEGGAALQLTVAVGIVKGQRMDWAVEKAAEMGAARFIPLATKFGVVAPGVGKLERWRKIALSAAKQSRRLTLMHVDEQLEFSDLLAFPAPLMAFDPSGKPISQLESEPGFRRPDPVLTAVVGPEGGFSPAELAAFESAAAILVSLGDHPLRTETAVVAALQVLKNFTEEAG